MAKCIDDLIQAAKGAISKKEAQEIIAAIERQFNRPLPKERPRGESGLPPEAKSPEGRMLDAADAAFKERLEEKQNAARRKELQIEKQVALQLQIVRRTKDGQYNTGLRDVINVSVAGRVKAITETFMTEMYRGLEPFLSKMGFRKLTPEEELGLARLLMKEERPGKEHHFDSALMSEAEYLASQYHLASDMAFNRANDAGADIKYLAGRIPQVWDAHKTRYYGLTPAEKLKYFQPGLASSERKRLRAKSQEGWVDFILPKLDRERYIDPETGAKLDDEQMREVMRDVWMTLATHGLAKDPGVVGGEGASLAEKLGAHREIHFKDAESWVEANQASGAKDLYQAMIGDLQRKAQSIAMMETFGPNPEQGFKTADAYAKSQQAQANLDGRHGATINQLMFDELMGKTASAQEDRFDIANRVMQGLRNHITAAKMGMLLLSQANDIATVRAIAQTDGLDTGRLLKVSLEMLNFRNKADREIARKQGILAQSVINDVALRFGAEQTQNLSRKMANWTVTLTGAQHWTNAMKQGFQTLIGSHVHDYKGLQWEQLQPRFRKMLERYDINYADWNIIRQAESVNLAGVEVVSPYLVNRVQFGVAEKGMKGARADKAMNLEVREAATKYGAMLAEEADTAMLSPGVREQAIIHQSTRPGTLWGEFARSMMLFKTFSIAMLTRALPRIFESGVGNNQASIAAQWIIGMMIGSAFTIQSKSIVSGKDPRDMTEPAFWAAALLQSGGMGIFGDFAFNDVNRFGGSLASTIGGPVVGFADDLRKLTVGNIAQAAEGKDTHMAAETIQFAKNYTPLMNLWYTRLALDHLLFFHVQEAANPGYLRRMKSRSEKENKQSFWWAPDDNMPDGLPNVAAMFGGKR